LFGFHVDFIRGIKPRECRYSRVRLVDINVLTRIIGPRQHIAVHFKGL
jgi:hypothetical protein